MKKIKNFKTCCETAEHKRAYNKELFRVVAPKYDIVTKLLSYNRDVVWKRKLIESLPIENFEGGLFLDIACGTGDLAFALACKFPNAIIHGIDLTPEMLAYAQAKNRHSNLQFSTQDMCHLTYPSESVDLITGSYALRNAPDLSIALKEFTRVLKPGGIAAFLDFSKSSSKMIQKLTYSLLKIWGGLWGLLLHRNPAIYNYIAESLKQYPDREKLHNLLMSNGLELFTKKSFFGGIIELVICKKISE